MNRRTVIRLNPNNPVVTRDGKINNEWYRAFEQMGIVANIIEGELTLAATAGAATLPATPEAFMSVILNGKKYKIPLYNE